MTAYEPVEKSAAGAASPKSLWRGVTTFPASMTPPLGNGPLGTKINEMSVFEICTKLVLSALILAPCVLMLVIAGGLWNMPLSPFGEAPIAFIAQVAGKVIFSGLIFWAIVVLLRVIRYSWCYTFDDAEAQIASARSAV